MRDIWVITDSHQEIFVVEGIENVMAALKIEADGYNTINKTDEYTVFEDGVGYMVSSSEEGEPLVRAEPAVWYFNE